jgi:single-stranded-DNA-specific exonuclease
MSTIIQRTEAGDISRLPETMHPVLRRVYSNRGITDAVELDVGLEALLPPDSLGGLERASKLIASILDTDGKILIVGDFDADGATSCALSVLCLREFGSASVDYLVPNRFEYGYGLSPEIVALAKQSNPDLIITVDNGISSNAGVRAANDAKIPVIITDHHLPGKELPEAAAIVNPNLPEDGFPAKSTAGVGVVFYLLLHLRRYLREKNWFKENNRAEPNLARYLDLVALGTVADVVPLEKNNRILVRQGLNRIAAGKCRPGITALLQIAGRNQARASASDLGFAVGPRLNAAGRLDDMSVGIECLLAESAEAAFKFATELDQMNRQRRQIEDEMKNQASKILKSWSLGEDQDLPAGLCLYDESWHQGVVGILASRIKERHHRPVIAFAPGENGELKGSARSIEGVHIRDVLDKLATRYPDLLRKFGGHAMAAGMSLDVQSYDAFKNAFEEIMEETLAGKSLTANVYSDGDIASEYFDLELAREIEGAGPWGQGFPEPQFDGKFKLLNVRVLKEKHFKLLVQPENSDIAIDAIAFNQTELHPEGLSDELHLVYRLDINEFRGNTSLQLIVAHIRSEFGVEK